MKQIPPQRYEFSSEDVDLLVAQFRELLGTGGFLTLGRHCEEFEAEFARYIGASHALTMNSGTAALEAIFRALGVQGWEVIVPTNTFAATAFAVIAAGGTPVFADILPDLTVDPGDVERRLTSRTKAVVTVHVGGLVSPHTRDLLEVCRRRGLELVEDAAHAHGSALDGRHAGTFGVAAAFSFFSTKVMTTGEGGMVVTGDESIAREVALLRDQGKVPGRENYHQRIGFNWRMTEFQALMGLAQLRRLDDFVERRDDIARIYDRILGQVQVLPLKVPAAVRHNFYKYVVFVGSGERDKLRELLKKDYGVGLAGNVYDLPCHEQPVFRAHVQGRLPVAEDLTRRHICLPVYYSLGDDDASYVARSLCEAVTLIRGES